MRLRIYANDLGESSLYRLLPMEPLITEKSWREAGPTKSTRRPPYLRRVLLVTVIMGLMVLFAVLLVKPLQHPDTHVVLLQGGRYRPLTVRRLPLIHRDADRIHSLDKATSGQAISDFSGLLRTPLELRKLEGRLRRIGIGKTDVLIAYVSAHGVSDQGTPYLLCDNFDPARPLEGRASVTSLLNQISAISCETKLLILDAGSLDYDPRLGVVVNEFPRLLQQSVARTADPSLWVLTSHAQFERSQISRALNGSVFGVFVEKGLRGAADADQDQVVNVDELFAFVHSHVTLWTTQLTGGAESQNPMLLWAGSEKSVRPNPQLMSISRFTPETIPLDVRSLVGVTDDVVQAIAETNLSDPRLLPRGVLSRSVAPDDALASQTTSDSPEASGRRVGPRTADGEPRSTATTQSKQVEEAHARSPAGQGTANDAALTDASLALLVNGWQLRDQLANAEAEPRLENRFPDQFPHLWRELQAELIEFEFSLRSRDKTGASVARTRLQQALAAAGPSPALATQDVAPTLRTGIRSALLGQMNGDQMHPGTLSVDQMLPGSGGLELTIPLQELVEAIDQDSEDAFRAWMEANWDDRYRKWYELRLIRQLADASDLDWNLIQLAARARLLSEQIVTQSLGRVRWVASEIQNADRMRWAGENQLLDQIGENWPQTASQSLRASIERYEKARSVLARIDAFAAFRNELVSRAPSYVRWHYAAARDAGHPAPQFDELAAFLDALLQFSDLLWSPTGTSMERLAKLHRTLLKQQRQIEYGCSDAFVDSLANASPGEGDAHRIERLLDTALPTSQSRWKLLFAANGFATELALSYALPTSWDAQVSSPVADGIPPAPADEWNRRRLQAQLEMMLAQLALRPEVRLPQSTSIEASTVTDTVDGYERRDASPERQLQVAFQNLPDLDQIVGNMAAREPLLYQLYRDFGTALSDFYVSLEQPIRRAEESRADWSPDVAGSYRRAGMSALSMLDARDAWQSRHIYQAELSERVDMFELLRFQQQRFAQAETLSTGGDSHYLAKISATFGHFATRVLAAQASFVNARLTVNTPATVSLVDKARQRIDISLTNNSSDTTVAWVVLKYDPQMLFVGAPARVFHEHRVQGVVADTLRIKESGNVGESVPNPPTAPSEANQQSEAMTHGPQIPFVSGSRLYKLLPGESTVTVPLALRRRLNPTTPTSLIIKVISGATLPSDSKQDDLAEERDNFRDVVVPAARELSYVRRKIEVQMPTVNVRVRSGENTWTASGDDLTLHPFPNRVTDYRFEILHGRQRFDPVRVDVYAMPHATDSAADDPFSGSLQVGSFESTPGVDALAAAQAIQSNDAPVSDSSGGQTEEQLPTGHAAHNGLLFVITNQATGVRSVKHIRFTPQRPRRYVMASVGYSATRQRIEVRVSPRDATLFPNDNVVVRCRIAGEEQATYEGKLQGEITGPDSMVNLYIDVPAVPPRRVTLQLDVDEYPRAFIYEVFSGHDATSIPEESELLTARLVPPLEKFLQGPLVHLPISLQIDAPTGSFQNSTDVVHLRLDGVDGMNADSSIRLNSDRDVQVFVEGVSPDGTVAVRTRVRDFELEMPSEGLSNVSALISAELIAGHRRHNTRLARFDIDAAPPVISRIDVHPFGDVVRSGRELQMTIQATDGMSGLHRISAGFVATEVPSANAVLLPGFRQSGHTWSVTLPTEGLIGSQRILIRATDVVGNVAETTRTVDVVTEEQMLRRGPDRAMRLTGRIIYFKTPVVGADVTLMTDDSQVVQRQISNDEGVYAFERVLPGKYRLMVRGVIRNVPRVTTEELLVEHGPGGNQRLNIVLE